MKKTDVLVSVIVPIYNVEKYIERCVNSLLTQSHKNLQIILVDDGTPDNSGKIIDRLAKTDNRICVIHKENSGVSTARNAGLDIAKGEYVLFVDGDDYVDKDYVSYFLGLAIDNNCEIAMNINNHTYKGKKNTNGKTKIIDDLTAIEYIYTGKIFVAVWNKIYKRSLLNKNGLRFNTEYWYGEGMLFNIECLQYVDKVALGDKAVYHQEYNPNSAMRNFSLESNKCGMRSMERQKAIWIKSNNRVEAAWQYHYRCFYYTILKGLIERDLVNKYPEEYKTCIKNLHRGLNIPLRVNITFKEKIIQIAIFFFPTLVAKWSAGRTKRLVKKIDTEKL